MFDALEVFWRVRHESCRPIQSCYRQVILQIDFLCDNRRRGMGPKGESEERAINILMAQGFSQPDRGPRAFVPVPRTPDTHSHPFFQEPERWEGDFRRELTNYEKLLFQAFKNGQFDVRKDFLSSEEETEFVETWSIANTMFFCGTIYTTIGKCWALNLAPQPQQASTRYENLHGYVWSSTKQKEKRKIVHEISIRRHKSRNDRSRRMVFHCVFGRETRDCGPTLIRSSPRWREERRGVAFSPRFLARAAYEEMKMWLCDETSTRSLYERLLQIEIA